MPKALSSDNVASVHPAIFNALASMPPVEDEWPTYGHDDLSILLQQQLASLFGATVVARTVSNGTGANIYALTTMVPRGGPVVACDTAHFNTLEENAVATFGQLRLELLPQPPFGDPGRDAKMRPAEFKQRLAAVADRYPPRDLVDTRSGQVNPGPVILRTRGTVVIEQATLFGAVYTPAELRQLADIAHENDWLVFCDGARLANAIVSTGRTPKEVMTDSGIDVYTFGTTKLGGIAAEAVIFANSDLVANPAYLDACQTRAGQRPAKSAYFAAQVLAALDGNLIFDIARHENAMATVLARAAAKVPGVTVFSPVDANIVRTRLDPGLASVAPHIQPAPNGALRWVTSWDTTLEDIAGIVNPLRVHVGLPAMEPPALLSNAGLSYTSPGIVA